MSEIEMVAAGRWVKPENVIRYLRRVGVGDSAVARLHKSWEERLKEGPADLSSET